MISNFLSKELNNQIEQNKKFIIDNGYKFIEISMDDLYNDGRQEF